jgi:hypothetical protein
MQSLLNALPRFDNNHEHYVQIKESNQVHVLEAGVQGTLYVDCATRGAYALIVQGLSKPWCWRLSPSIVCEEIFDLVAYVF